MWSGHWQTSCVFNKYNQLMGNSWNAWTYFAFWHIWPTNFVFILQSFRCMDMKTKKECSTCKAFSKLGKWMCLPSQHFSFLNFLSSCSRLLYSITMWSRENNHLISLWPFSQFSISRELVSAYKHLGPELKRLDLISFFLFFIVF